MPCIVISNSKGGSGKTTVAVILATESARLGVDVTLIDCNHAVGRKSGLEIWAKASPLPRIITLRHGLTEADVIRAIRLGEGDNKLVVVDLGHTTPNLSMRALSQADLVLVPMRVSKLDADHGADTIRLINEVGIALGRSIPFSVMLTATKLIRSMAHRELVAEFSAQGIDLVEPELLDRIAFSKLFECGSNLMAWPPQGSFTAALDNAQLFTEVVLLRLQRALVSNRREQQHTLPSVPEGPVDASVERAQAMAADHTRSKLDDRPVILRKDAPVTRQDPKRVSVELDGQTYWSLRRLGIERGEKLQTMCEQAIKDYLIAFETPEARKLPTKI